MHRLGSDVGINGVEGIFIITSNYWFFSVWILRCSIKSWFSFHSHWLLFVKCKSFGPDQSLESQDCQSRKSKTCICVVVKVLYIKPVEKTTLKMRTLHPFKSGIAGRMVCIGLIWERGPTDKPRQWSLILSDTSPFPFFRPSRWPKDRWLVFHSAEIFLGMQKSFLCNILWICTCLTLLAQCWFCSNYHTAERRS